MRRWLAMALILAGCIVDMAFRAQNTWSVSRWWGRGDIVSRSTSRFDAVRSRLPARGIVGYQFQGKDSSVAAGITLAQ
jgi:hypothetical protein